MPTLELENAIREESGLTYIAGLDEAGRGAIAGPVFAAAVLLPLDEPEEAADPKRRGRFQTSIGQESARPCITNRGECPGLWYWQRFR